MQSNNDIPLNKFSEEPENFKNLWEKFKHFISELINIRNNTDKSGTIEDIKNNISIKGHTAWILVFSILIASIGLNVSSTAVVIGAMLISPLMGPILGIGLSIGINDIDTLKRSMINLGVMLSLSLITSFAFFSLPLFQELTPELFARTQPNVLDVMIAISGGLALIVAISRPSAQTNTVAGVAIATALMPPLCTAGYGLAVGKLDYFLGAMFLFLINTTFIALSTFVIVKYLRFPMVKYINSAKRRSVSRFASFIAILVLTGSIYTFYNLYQEKEFDSKAKKFFQSVQEDGFVIIDKEKEDINFEENSIDITVFGKSVSTADEQTWKNRLIELGMNENIKLYVHKGKDDTKLINEFQNLKNQVAQNQKIIDGRDASIRSKEERIQFLENERAKFIENQVPFIKISEEAKTNYENLQEFAYSRQLKTNFSKVDTLTVFYTKWQESMSIKDVDNQELKLKKWLKIRLDLDTLKIVRE